MEARIKPSASGGKKASFPAKSLRSRQDVESKPGKKLNGAEQRKKRNSAGLPRNKKRTEVERRRAGVPVEEQAVFDV